MRVNLYPEIVAESHYLDFKTTLECKKNTFQKIDGIKITLFFFKFRI